MRMATALATAVLTFGLGATAQAGTTSNLIAANKLAGNRVVLNRVVLNRIVTNRLAANGLAANGPSSAVPAGEGAAADIVGIELPDGTKLTR